MAVSPRGYIFIVTLIFIAASRRTKCTETNYENFENCLRKTGVHSESIVSRGSSAYYQDLNYQWQARGSTLHPLAYIRVQNEGDVVATVRCGKRYKIHLIPKGGGHSLEKLSFGDSHSVIVDVRDLNTVIYEEANMTATVGAGLQIGPLAWKLWELGQVFTPLGECPTVGISGMATGGGWGYFTRKLGMALDNILEMNIVTANGELTTVNQETYPDLFWALRGGVGSSFGIVTKFLFRVYPAPAAMFFGSLTYDIAQLPQVFDAWQREVPHSPNDITPSLDIGDGQLILKVFDPNGTPKNFEELSKKYPTNPIVNRINFTFPEFMFYQAKNISEETMTPATILNTPADLGLLVPRSPAQVWQKRKSFYVNKIIGTAGIRQFQALIQKMPSTIEIYLEPYGGYVDKVGRNETAFVHRSGTLYNAVADYRNLDQNATAVHTEATEFIKEFFESGKSIFKHTRSYQNYVDREISNYLERYYGENLPRLVEIKRKYDPDNFFFNLQSIPVYL